MNSQLSRNYSFGIALGQGHSVQEVLDKHGVVEGYYTASAVWHKSEILQVEMPITNALYRILYHSKEPAVAIRELLTRELKIE
jgi:glycerol-3-phosphate dehydrogenase (NAD(P)+)